MKKKESIVNYDKEINKINSKAHASIAKLRAENYASSLLTFMQISGAEMNKESQEVMSLQLKAAFVEGFNQGVKHASGI